MTIRQDEAIILRTRDYRESDRLITFFSRSQGQLTGIAKGARRSKKRFVHTLEPLSHVLITYADRSSSGLVRIDASELKNGFIELRNQVARLGYASLCCEAVLEISPERQANTPVFTLLHQFLTQLDRGGEPENSSFLFLLRMLSLSGFAPNLQSCLRCGRDSTSGQSWYFSISRGGLLCETHHPGGKVYRVSLGTVMVLRQAQQLPLAKVWRLRFNRQSRDECRFLLLDLVRHHLEKDLKSLRLLSQIGALEATKSSVNL